MISDPVSSGLSQTPADRPDGDAWTAQGFALQGERVLAWFEALRTTQPGFCWAGLFACIDGQVRVLVQSRREDDRAQRLLGLVETTAAARQLKLSVIQGNPRSLTAMAVPLDGTDFLCVALLERKLVEASRLSGLFEISADRLATLLATPSPAEQEIAPRNESFSDADLLDLLVVDTLDGFAQALFSRLAARLNPDQALLAHLGGERVQVLRTSLAVDPLPAGSRVGQARLAALRTAARSDKMLFTSHAMPIGEVSVELADLANEDSAIRAITLCIPWRDRGQMVWLASWDAPIPEFESHLEALFPRLQRLMLLLEAVRPQRRRAWLDGLPRWTDPRGWRLWAALAAGVLSVWLLLPAPFHVVGEASLRSTAQRSLVAPRDGFLNAVHVRAGDTVRAGEILAEFDVRELVLRQSRIDAQIAQAQSRRMGAMAEFNTAMVQISDAEIAAMSAERDLIALLLTQSRLVAEEDAIVISGNVVERVGTAMRHGEPMFELAPLAGFTVAIDIPQRDITEVDPGQGGWLKLTALPFDSFPVELERVSLSATGQDGAPGFVGLARLDAEHEAFRSGMQGTVQIEAGRTLRAWVLLRDFVFWVQMQWWRWVP